VIGAVKASIKLKRVTIGHAGDEVGNRSHLEHLGGTFAHSAKIFGQQAKAIFPSDGFKNLLHDILAAIFDHLHTGRPYNGVVGEAVTLFRK